MAVNSHFHKQRTSLLWISSDPEKRSIGEEDLSPGHGRLLPIFLGLSEGSPDLLPVGRTAVVGTEWYQATIGGCVVDATPLHPGEIVVIGVHEVHRTDEEGIPVELPESLEIL